MNAFPPPPDHFAGRLPAGTRVYAVGDVHGRDDLFSELLEMIQLDICDVPVDRAMLVMLGDYLDRGPDGPAVLDRLLAPLPRGLESVFLKGNHEQHVLNVLDTGVVHAAWLRYGGGTTLQAYGIKPPLHEPVGKEREALAQMLMQAMPPGHQAFLRQLETSVRIGGFFFCHAGIRPGVALEDQDDHDLMWIRRDFLDWDGDAGAIIVHGHTPGDVPDVRANRICLDTTAYASGMLTCAALDAGGLRFIHT